MPPKVLVAALAKLVMPLPHADYVAVGFPGVVRDGRILTAPHFGNTLWRGYNLIDALERRFRRPVRIINDAEMQGLAAVKGLGLEFVLTLGTEWERHSSEMAVSCRTSNWLTILSTIARPTMTSSAPRRLRTSERRNGTSGFGACFAFSTL